MTDVIDFPSPYKPETQQGVRIGVAMPTHDRVPARFAYDLAQLASFTAAQMPAGCEFGINMLQGTYIHSARQELLEAMLQQGVTHILWVDSDMSFPRDALVRLLHHQKKAVGINYSKRVIPPEFVAFKSLSWEPDGESERLQTTEESTGLEEVEALGFGLFLLRRDALVDLPDLDETPWFWFDWISGRRQVGEDVWFCRMLRERGVKLYVDHDLSKLCGHIGEFTYRCEHAVAAGQMEADEE